MNDTTTTSATLAIDRMSCDGCVRRVTAVLRKIPGVLPTDVHVGGATVTYEVGTTPEAILAALSAAGYPSRVVDPRA
jgi:copper chaperone CopZ